MKKIIILISALILCFPLITCSDLGQAVKLKIYYSADGFTGFHVADAGNAVLMDVGATGGAGGIYEVNVSMTTNLKVQVTSKSLTNTLSVMVYKDNLLVKDGTSTGTGASGTAAAVTLFYEYDPSKTTTSTTTK